MSEPTTTEIDPAKTKDNNPRKDNFSYLDARDPAEPLSTLDQQLLDNLRAMTLRRLERVERLVPHVPGHQAWADIQVPYLQKLAAYTQEHSVTVADLNAVRFLDDEVLRYATYVDHQLRKTGFTESVEAPRAGLLPSEEEIKTDNITAEELPTLPQQLQEQPQDQVEDYGTHTLTIEDSEEVFTEDEPVGAIKSAQKTPKQLRDEMYAQQPDIEGDEPVVMEPRDLGNVHVVPRELNDSGELDALVSTDDDQPIEAGEAEEDQEVASRNEILDRFKQWVEREAIMVERYRAASGEDRAAAETRLQRIRNIIDHYLEEAGYQVIRKSPEGRALEARYLDNRLALPLETGRARTLAMKEHQAERIALEKANVVVELEQRPKPVTNVTEQSRADRVRILRQLDDTINTPPTFGYEKWFQQVTALAEGLYNARQGGEQDAYQFWLSAARNLEANPARWFTGRWEQRKQFIDEQRKRYLDVVREQNQANAA